MCDVVAYELPQRFGILYNGGKFQICPGPTRLYELHTPNRRRKSYSIGLSIMLHRDLPNTKRLSLISKEPLNA